MSLALSVFAASGVLPAGIYGRLSATVAGVPVNFAVPTTTAITTNPDYARLKIEAEFSNGLDLMYTHSAESARGITSYSRNLPIYLDDVTNEIPAMVHTAHSVKDGTGTEFYTVYLRTYF